MTSKKYIVEYFIKTSFMFKTEEIEIPDSVVESGKVKEWYRRQHSDREVQYWVEIQDEL